MIVFRNLAAFNCLAAFLQSSTDEPQQIATKSPAVIRNQKSEICSFNPFINYIKYSLIFTNILIREISVKEINIAAGKDNTPTMKKRYKISSTLSE